MAFRHFRDPAKPYEMIERLAKRVPQRVLERDDIMDAAFRVAQQDMGAAPEDMGHHWERPDWVARFEGVHGRLAWHLRDCIAHWERKRDQCEWAIRRAIQPMLDRHDRAMPIRVEARVVNNKHGMPFLSHEVDAIVASAMEEHMAREDAARRKRRYAR